MSCFSMSIHVRFSQKNVKSDVRLPSDGISDRPNVLHMSLLIITGFSLVCTNTLAEVTMVTLEVALWCVVIGQDVAIELQWVNIFNYFQLTKGRVNLVKFKSFFDYIFFFLKNTCSAFRSILAVLASLSGFNFSSNSDTFLGLFWLI